MAYKLVFTPENCVACNGCVIACMDQKDTDAASGERPCRKPIEYDMLLDQKYQRLVRTAACLHCLNAPCITACPNGCIFRDEVTGFVGYADQSCTGCQACKAACPFDAISFSKEGRIRKCDGCLDRVRAGMQPACVLACPTQALIIKTDDKE